MLYTVQQAARKLGVHPQTIRRWDREGRMPALRTQGNHRRYDLDNVLSEKRTVCYCRVSSAKQKDDLERQVAFMRSRFPDIEVVTDIGSGLNFKRRGLASLLDRLARGEKFDLVVAYRDRLARFGSELIERFLRYNGGELVVLNQIAHSPQQELCEDILAILTVFSARVNGLRRYRKQIAQDSDLSDDGTETTNPPVDGREPVDV